MSSRQIGTGRFGPGDVVNDRYEILAPLGQGGMGEAYKARDRSDNGLVVVKIPHASMIGDPSTYSRYERELDIGKSLSHPSIQRLVAEGRLDGGIAPFVVFEYIDGRNLRDLLSHSAPLPQPEAIDLAAQIADILQYVHDHGVIHRDLKPENLLLTPDHRVKLVDFGIALLRGARRLTFAHLSNEVGTPDYMAPEQVQGERGDNRTDIYALGVMLYEMLTGEVPYRGDNPLAVMGQRVTTPAPLVRSRRRDISPQLEAIVFRALRRDPRNRYSSMADMAYDLRHLDQVEIPNYADFDERPRATTSHRYPALIVVAILLSLVLIGIGAELLHRSATVH